MPELTVEQIEGAEFIASKAFGLLADDMGVGKTAQIVHATDIIQAERILVICPATARENWVIEYDMWAFMGSHGFQLLTKGSDFPKSSKLICSFDYARDYFERFTAMEKFDVVIVDECQNIKEPEAAITRAVYGKEGIVRNTKRMWLMSGTPAPNNYAELWPMLFTFGITKLKYEAFVSRYCSVRIQKVPKGKPRLVINGSKSQMAGEIKEMIAKFSIRRTKEETIKDLPPLSVEHVFVEPMEVDLGLHPTFVKYSMNEKAEAEFYDILETERRRLADVIDILGVGRANSNPNNVVSVLEGIAPSVSTLRRYNGVQKIQGIIDLVFSELTAGKYDKIVLIAVHQDVILGIRDGLSKLGIDVVTLYGKTPSSRRQKNISRFQTNPKCQVFIGQIKAAGVAITLTAAAEIMMVEWNWTPADNAQAIMRVHRRTQTRPVRCRFACIRDSIDDKISYTYKRKAKELTAVFNGENAKNEGDA